MVKQLKFKSIIENIIGEINEAKRKSESIHRAGNIPASGTEVEDLIREKISLFLPERYLVKQGHIVNSEGFVSNQLDIIIFDRLSTPKFFETQNKTVFYPIESVLAIGEIKKTLRKKDLLEFGKKIKFLKDDMKRKLIENTVFGGQITDESSLSDIINMRTDRKYKNPLFSFIFAIDVEDIENLEINDNNKYMPNDVYILNHGIQLYGEIINKSLEPYLEDETKSGKWIYIKRSGVVCLAMLFNHLINHLNNCKIEPFSISNYMSDPADFSFNGSDVKMYNFSSEE